ncbi:MAG: DUF1420 family protein [Myxococcota bacterium]
MELEPFRPLEGWLLPPPLPALVALLVVNGLRRGGERLARTLLGPASEPVDRASCVVVLLAMICALLHAVAWWGVGLLPFTRVVGTTLLVLGLPGWPRVPALPPAESRRERWFSALAIFTALMLTIAALGPATDADSRDYHLGVPLDWLNHGGIHPRADWPMSRVTGLGELVVLLGLAMGTDCLSALVQAGAVALLMTTLVAEAPDRTARTLGLLYAATTPVLLSLVTSQKPQVLPAVALALAFITLTRAAPPSSRQLALAVLCALFAASCKYSMIPPAALLVGYALVRTRAFPVVGAAAATGFLLFLLPLQLRSYLAWGDPLSPLLERFRENPDPGVVAFAEHLRNHGGPRSVERLVRLAAELVVPLSSDAHTLGVGVLGVMLVGRERMLLLLPATAALITLVAGQLNVRFFLEPFWWVAVLVVRHAHGRPRNALLMAMGTQALVVTTVALLGAVILGRGMLSPSARDDVMLRHAEGYAQGRYVDEHVEPDAVLFVGHRLWATMPRRAYAVGVLSRAHHDSPGPALRAVEDGRGPVYVVREVSGPTHWLEPCLGNRVGEPSEIPQALRNPFRESRRTTWEIRPLRLHEPVCRSLLRLP